LARAVADDLFHVIGPPLLAVDVRAAVAAAVELGERDAAPLNR
jgi:hypothetical protein